MTPPKNFLANTAPEIHKLLDQDKFIGLLMKTTIFHDIPVERLPLADLEELARGCDVINVFPNKPLPLQHDFLYEIISGYVKIYEKASPLTVRVKKSERIPRALLAWRVPGELLGDFHFALSDEAISDDIVTTDKCKLLKIPSATVHGLAQRYPLIYFNIARNLAAKASKSRVRAQVLRLSDIEPKLAKLFLELVKERRYDEKIYTTERVKVINGTFRHPDIGAFLGYGKRRVTEGVQALIREGLLDHYKNNSSGRFVISDEQGLLDYLEKCATC